ncbi:putative fatty acyl-CoA reductase CG5065, partial [Leptinotarsa decemlineata]|uniref:putative fatty acyl-CoA reductase CG5065 n=1 Tax=Leptinotarsa decemlineata TaxID=7539 RepID=UPI003D30BA1E
RSTYIHHWCHWIYGKNFSRKILRSCSKVAAIYILVRPKKGKESWQRIDEFLNSPVFHKLRNSPNSEEVLKKLKCISGDVTQVNCGLSPEDQTKLNNSVTIVFHMAANVRFDQPVKSAILLNTGGTLNVLEMACNFHALKIFVHVSTSYCHCDVTRLEERLYCAPQDPRKMLDLAKWMSDELLEALTPVLLKNHPNTYSYTKSLTEQLVSEYNNRLPIVITRPSIVVAAYRDPIPGWVDNMNGPTGILIGAGKGVIRTMHCDLKLGADVVPVDMVINSLLVIAWKVGSGPRTDQAEVYHITANKNDPVSWGYALELGKKYVYKYPFSVCLWYPGGSAKSTYFMHAIAAFFFHWIPAYSVDLIIALTGSKPFLVKTQKRIQNGLKVLQYYATRPWFFHNEKFTQLFDSLSSTDKEIFYSNRESLNFEEYMQNYILGARKYCAREEIDTLPHARKVLKRLYYLDVLKNILIVILFLWLGYKLVCSFMRIVES